MIKVECKYCDYELRKPKWEHIIYTVRKEGGDIRKNTCPGCEEKGLVFDWGEEE